MLPGWDTRELAVLAAAARRLAEGFRSLPPGVPDRPLALDDDAFALPPVRPDSVSAVLLETAERLCDNYPYFHPRYAGQMLKPPHPVARLAYALAMLINPNNHALDGGRASSELEKEAVAALASLVDWTTHLGHLTGGGTMANMEALWVASRLAPGRTVLASEQAHYTHARLSDVLGLPFESVPADERGRLDPVALARRLARGDVGAVVATVGTTAFGALDPLPELLALRERYGFVLHADAAYGGYFGLVDDLPADARRVYDALPGVDSLVVDPHKHGLQPYGCGAVLFRDPSVGRFYRHDSPYTYFTEAELHLGEISLECSRAGAAATALWATQRLLPPVRGGAFAAGLARCLAAARGLFERLEADERFLVLMPPELDIVVWAPAAPDAEAISTASRRLFQAAAELDLHLALVRVDAALAARRWPGRVRPNDAPVTCLRCCLMKPEHLDWLDELWSLVTAALERTRPSG
ncbi:MAG TPA: aminotransferase class V-fold PLP-dependent enzyme [Pseudomonadales bacterium]